MYLIVLLFIIILIFLIIRLKNRTVSSLINCHHHPETSAVGTCHICENYLCSECIKEHGLLSFCSNHEALFLNSSWREIFNILASPEKPENAMPLYDLKKKLWIKEKMPSYIITKYKNDIECDHIDSIVKLFVREEDIGEIVKKLNSIHYNHQYNHINHL